MDNIFRELHDKYYIITTYLRKRNHDDMIKALKDEKAILELLNSEQNQSLCELGLMLPLKIIQGQRNHRAFWDFLEKEFIEMDMPHVYVEQMIHSYKKIYQFWDATPSNNITKVLTRSVFRIPWELSRKLNLKRTNPSRDDKLRTLFLKDPTPYFPQINPLLTPLHYQQLNQLVFHILQKNWGFPDVFHIAYVFANYHWENLFDFSNRDFKVRKSLADLKDRLELKEKKLKWAEGKRFERKWITKKK